MTQEYLGPISIHNLSPGILPSWESFNWQSWISLPASLPQAGASLVNLALILLAAAVGGAIIFAGFRFYFRGVPISHQLEASLVPATVLATLFFYQSGDWPGLPILLVAVLGFIHFRTVVKDMTDSLFAFWTILSGIFIGAGFPLPTLAADAILAISLIIYVSRRSAQVTYLLLLRYDPKIAGHQMMDTIKHLHGRIRSQFEKNGLTDLTVEVRLCYINMETIDRIAAMTGVHTAILVGNDGNPGL